MPRVLVAGCGYLGAAVAQKFVEKEWEVTGWNRSGIARGRGAARAFPLHAVDISDPMAVSRRKIAVDVVVHCGSSGGGDLSAYQSVYLDGITNLSRCFPSAHLIFTSSTSVYVQCDGQWVMEESPARPESASGKVLLAAEAEALARAGTVLRVAGIYGPGRSALLRGVLAGNPMRLPEDRFVNQVHRDDIVSAVLLVAQKRCGGIFNVVDDRPAKRSEILEWLAQRLAIVLSNEVASSQRRRGESNKRVSNACLRQNGWIPQYPNYQQAFERSILPALDQFGC